jgi:hypothetical protein
MSNEVDSDTLDAISQVVDTLLHKFHLGLIDWNGMRYQARSAIELLVDPPKTELLCSFVEAYYTRISGIDQPAQKQVKIVFY